MKIGKRLSPILNLAFIFSQFSFISCSSSQNNNSPVAIQNAQIESQNSSDKKVETKNSFVSTNIDAKPQVIVLYVSDLHGRLRSNKEGLGGYARLASLIKAEKAKAGPRSDVFVVAGGDIAGKSALPCRKTGEKPCFALLKDVGIDVGILGNGELKRSAQELNALIDASGIQWISGNVNVVGGPQNWHRNFDYRAPKSGARLHFASWTVAPSPGEIDLKKAKLNVRSDMVENDWALIQGQTKKSDGLIWLTHLELEADRALLSASCAKDSLNVLALLKANDHLQMSMSDLCAPIFAPAPFGHSVSRMVLAPDVEGRWKVSQHEFISVNESVAEDTEIKARVLSLYQQEAPTATEVIAEVQNNTSEEEFAKWVGRAFRKVTRADLSIVNLGGVKDNLKAGPLSREDLLMVYPYTDEIMGLDWSARDLEKSLCEASRRKNDPYEDYGSTLVLEGAELVDQGLPSCRLEGPKRASYKVALVNYLVKRSKRWLGKDLQSLAFKFQVNTEQAFEKMLKDSGRKL